MTDTTDQVDDRPTAEVPFQGRMITMAMPLPEQILVWRRILVRLQETSSDDWNGEQVLAALEQLRKILDSIIVHPADIAWMDDQMLAGRLTLRELAPLFVAAISRLTEDQPDTAAKPVKKASRKKASPRQTGE